MLTVFFFNWSFSRSSSSPLSSVALWHKELISRSLYLVFVTELFLYALSMDIASLVGRHYKASIFFDWLFDCYYVRFPLRLVVKVKSTWEKTNCKPQYGR